MRKFLVSVEDQIVVEPSIRFFFLHQNTVISSCRIYKAIKSIYIYVYICTHFFLEGLANSWNRTFSAHQGLSKCLESIFRGSSSRFYLEEEAKSWLKSHGPLRTAIFHPCLRHRISPTDVCLHRGGRIYI